MSFFTESRRGLAFRFLWGFSIGVGICVVYWAFGFVPREVWFGSPIAAELITGHTWLWPTAFLGVVFRDVNLPLAVIGMYSLNGLVYGLVSASLFAAKRKAVVYALLVAALILSITWFNASILQAFSWIWFAVILGAISAIAARDLRREKGRPAGDPTTTSGTSIRR
jgi:hypothetical protein